MKKILITDYVYPELPQWLAGKGYEVEYNKNITREEVKSRIGEFHGIVINSKIIMDEPMIRLGHQLEFIVRLGSGMEIVDIPFSRSQDIRVINTPEGNSGAVGEHTLGMLLSLCNNLCRGNTEVKKLFWKREANRGNELRGKKIGIIGFGHTGSQFAYTLQGLGIEVWAHDKYKRISQAERPYIKESSLDGLLDNVDIISFHLPLTKETIHFCDDSMLSRCRDEVIIINTSRGEVLDTKALIRALHKGKVKGACLDVFENEKPDTYSKEEERMYKELFSFSNVIVSPHVAGWTHESLLRIAKLVLERIENGYTLYV